LVQLIPLNLSNQPQKDAAEAIYAALTATGIEVLYDDREERAGVKFNDADLIGLPIRITIGDKSLKDGKVELKARAEATMELVPVDGVVEAVKKLAARLT
jgi:prolyl-tRNA synthetase